VVADEAAAEALRTARLLVSGSAPLPVPVFDRLAELTGHRPIERYGASESLITISTRADGERRAGWVGLPVAGVETRLLTTTVPRCPTTGKPLASFRFGVR
jgi:fatty acid CoA ligase FadD36